MCAWKAGSRIGYHIRSSTSSTERATCHLPWAASMRCSNYSRSSADHPSDSWLTLRLQAATSTATPSRKAPESRRRRPAASAVRN